MWDALGFRESPYNTNPLFAQKEDVELLVGREAEAIELATNLGTAAQGIQVISGAPGVGKTSFFNVQQYKLENGLSPYGPRVLAARHLCPVQPNDDLRDLALRALTSLYKSVEQWSAKKREPTLPETAKIGNWLASTGSTATSIGISIAGFGGSIGRNVQLPRVSDVTFEAIGEAIAAIAAETTTNHGFDSVVIALDNLENFESERLGEVLISLRDTLFSTPRVWWVLIGQSGLGSLIQSLDSRVFERTTGSGLEIGPLGLEEMHAAISLRVQRFHTSGAGTSPLGAETHKFLYEASSGETRFVFKYSNSICAKFVEVVRSKVWSDPDIKRQQSEPDARERFSAALDAAIARLLINKQIAHPLARSYLQGIVGAELQGLFLKPKEKQVLAKLGELGSARASDHKAYAVKSAQDFSSNYLSKFHGQNLLAREQQGRAVLYRLRGMALLAHTFGFLSQS